MRSSGVGIEGLSWLLCVYAFADDRLVREVARDIMRCERYLRFDDSQLPTAVDGDAYGRITQ